MFIIMKIVLSGVETNNKGAELMLYAILQEIERKYPEADVYIKYTAIKQGLEYIHTPLRLHYLPFSKFLKKTKLHGIFNLLHLPAYLMQDTYAIKDADYFIDGSGFLFTDQWNATKEDVWLWEKLLSRLYRQGCKIIFLPQAFGPLELSNTQKLVATLNDYSSVIMVREMVSYNYLNSSGLLDMEKVKLFPDFTSKVDGLFPQKYSHLKNGVCVIPNIRMLDKANISFEEYVSLLESVVNISKKKSLKVYFLNHEGLMDEKLAYKCSKTIQGGIEVVTGLNALEVKGLISTAYLVITSRFHGAVSALNSCVPCLATSWSHKYGELFKDYQMTDNVLPIENRTKALEMVDKYLDKDINQSIRKKLAIQLPHVLSETEKMWECVWNV